jgi:hypothetical protein
MKAKPDRRRIACKALIIVALVLSFPVKAQLVKYDEGAVFVRGMTFLQDANDPSKYYYLPRFPRLAMKDDGTLEFLCLKYTGDKTENSGGLLHALVDLSVPDSILGICRKALDSIVPGAKIIGQVPLMENKKDDKDEGDVESGFEIVSAVLSNKGGKESMTRSVVSSGHAPFTPGSKSAIAAILSPQGSTLLWNSFTGPTSDVSLAINGYYRAMTRAYNAIVTADMKVIYRHFSEMSNNQEDFTKEQIRKVFDTMTKNGTIKIDVADQSTGLGVKTTDMEGILSVITTKLTELMFDSKTGWSASPEVVDPNLGFNPAGRRGQRSGGLAEAIGAVGDMAQDVIGALPVVGWFSRKRDTNPKYVTDHQYVLKDVNIIRTNKFYLNLSKSIAVKVPFHTAGNLSGLYDKMGNDERYFRVVNMSDPDYQQRNITFQVDGDYVDAFDDIINFVTVVFRKKYGTGHEDVTAQLMINGNDLKKDIKLKEISYPRLGIKSADWLNYEYQLIWSFRGRTNPVRIPDSENQWIKSNAPAISLTPPLAKKYIELDADRQEFSKNNVSSVNISFASMQAGDKKVVRSAILRAEDKNSTNKIIIYHDKDSPVAYQATWYSKENGKAVPDMSLLSSNYLFLVPPAPDKFVK